MDRKDIVTCVGEPVREMTEALLEEADLQSLIPGKDCLIGIKPNLVGQVPASDGATTHPEVIEGLLRYLKKYGYSRIVVLEGSWVGDSTPEAVRCCGYDTLLEEYQIPFWDMQKEPAVMEDCAGMKLHIGRRALEIDFLINVPVLKGHCQTRMTCALKNLKGLLPNAEKRRFHRMGLHQPIAHLAARIRQDFILVDAICPDLTFEDGGNPVKMDLLAAARDPVLCDTWGCGVIGIDPSEVPYIGLAAGLGAGSDRMEEANLREFRFRDGRLRQKADAAGTPAGEMESGTVSGEKESGAVPGEKESGTVPGEKEETGTVLRGKAGYRHVLRLADNVEEVDSCSACYGYLIPALERLDQEGLLGQLKEKIHIGQGFRGKKGHLGIGSCTCLFDWSLKGCPPTEEQMVDFLKDYLQRQNLS